MKKVLFWTVMAVLAAVFLYSAWSLGSYLVESVRNSNTYGDLQEMLEQNRPSRPAVTQPTAPVPDETTPTLPVVDGPSKLVTVTDPDTGLQVQVLPEFEKLYALNNDLVGWIEIPGTNVCYPVVQTPESPDYYLRRDFYGDHATHGCIYVKEECDVFAPSDNVTIYGHRMHDGSMFYDLLRYKERSYFEDNPYVLFDHLTQRHTYQILAVFQTTASVGQGFRYQAFVDAQTEADFNNFVDTCKALAYYDTGVDASYGDKLITLSTCDYEIENGRFVVVAKRIA